MFLNCENIFEILFTLNRFNHLLIVIISMTIWVLFSIFYLYICSSKTETFWTSRSVALCSRPPPYVSCSICRSPIAAFYWAIKIESRLLFRVWSTFYANYFGGLIFIKIRFNSVTKDSCVHPLESPTDRFSPHPNRHYAFSEDCTECLGKLVF